MSLSDPLSETTIVEFIHRCLCPEIGAFRQESLEVILGAKDGKPFVQINEAHHHILFVDLTEVKQKFAFLVLVFHLPEIIDLSTHCSHFCQ